MQVGILHVTVLTRGESPMRTFGHPEVYIWAPFSLFFRYAFLGMLSYYLSIKTLFWNICRNNDISSRNESHLRGSTNLKNNWQVTLYMGRLTNKIHLADLPLDDSFTVDIRLFELWIQPECIESL